MVLSFRQSLSCRETFERIAEALNEIAADMPIFFPVHPRTKKMMADFAIKLSDRIVQLPPLGFTESLFLWKDAQVVITDSGRAAERIWGVIVGD